MNKEQFIVQGMHCASCALTVERALKKVAGVKNAAVNFATEKATVEYEDGLDAEKLEEAVAKTGYQLVKSHDHKPEKIKNSEEGEHDHHKMLKQAEIQLLRKKFILGGVLSVLIIILSFPDYLPFIKELIPASLRFFLLLILTIPVEFWVGYQFWRGAWFGLKNFTANMDSLVVLGTGAAFISSAIAAGFEIAGVEIRGLNVYFDVAAVVTTLVILGKYLEARAKGSASEAIKKLLKLQAKTAHLLHGGRHEMDIPIEEIKPDDILIVKPGEKIPVDGVIIEGTSAIDESMVSGESMPIDKKIGDQVIGATINKTGAFRFRATKVGKETFLAQIIKIVEEAQNSKAPIQKFADAVTAYFVPIVLAIAIVSFVIWLIFGPAPAFNFALINAVAVLVVACPCALGLATPTAIMVGTGKGAEKGIIIRDAEALEMAGKIDTIVLDKTGTLTKGEPSVTDVIALTPASDKAEIARFAASLEKLSEHPIAKAVVAYAAGLGEQYEVKNFLARPGKGIEGEITVNDQSQKLSLGNRLLIREINVSLPAEIETKANFFESEGKTVLFLANKKSILGAIAVADTLKESAPEAIKFLDRLGLEVWLITGDNERTAEAVAGKLGIKNVMAKVLPQEKSEKVKELQRGNPSTGLRARKVAMVGDGINDAPALAQADLGIAIGTGTDVAIESAGITLISGDPMGIYGAIKLSRQTLRNIKQNLFWAYIYNIVLIPVAAGLLWPIWGITLNPILAGGAMALSSLSVVLNSLRLKKSGL